MIRTMGIAKLMLSRDIIFSCTTDNRITIKKLAVIIIYEQQSLAANFPSVIENYFRKYLKGENFLLN
ncbi:hypothetical protein BK136_07795 [Paenibacillus amylolyticus]|nr:hypothetical protein BK136_07795 [Paenibacillus amylolyticus]